MRIGYARVSTDDQNFDLQRDSLKPAAGPRKITEREWRAIRTIMDARELTIAEIAAQYRVKPGDDLSASCSHRYRGHFFDASPVAIKPYKQYQRTKTVQE